MGAQAPAGHGLTRHIRLRLSLVDLQRVQPGERHDAGVVDQDIDASVPFVRRADECAHALRVGHIQHVVFGTATRGPDVRGDGGDPVGSTCAEEHPVARAGQPYGRGVPDPAARPGDQDDFADGRSRRGGHGHHGPFEETGR
jgi:hypothetical protein